MKFLSIILLIFTTFMLTSCYKEDIHIKDTSQIFSSIDHLEAECYLKQRHTLLCKKYEYNGNVTKVEFDISTKTINPANYELPYKTYWVKSNNQIYSAKKGNSANEVLIYNVLSGNKIDSFNLPYNVSDVGIAEDKLIVTQNLSSNYYLHMYDLNTKSLISSLLRNGSSGLIHVSAGDKIFVNLNTLGYSSSFDIDGNNISFVNTAYTGMLFFNPQQYSISGNGIRIVSNVGDVFDDRVDRLTTLYTHASEPFLKCYTSIGSSGFLGLTEKNLIFYDANTFQESDRVNLDFTSSYKFVSAVPIYYNNGSNGYAVNISNGIHRILQFY